MCFRLISMNSNIKLVIEALIKSFAPVFNVMVFGIIIYLIFAIIGFNLYHGLFGYCSTLANYYAVSKDQVLIITFSIKNNY